MYVCVCMFIHTPYVCMCRPEINVRCLPLFLSILPVDIGSLTEHHVCLVG